MSQAGWEEHLRNFIAGASPDERDGSIYKKVLWIHAPDYSRNGVIGDIKNVTRRETQYHKLWESMDVFEQQYEKVTVQPMHTNLDKHRDLFMSDYDSLTDEQKAKYARLVKGNSQVNPYEEDKIVKMLQAGLERSSYEKLMTSYYENVNMTLSAPIPYLNIDGPDREALKWIYKDRAYFRTLEFRHDEISAWLRYAVNETLVGLGIGKDLN